MNHTLHSNLVISGMRPTGRLHLGHYHGVLKNWISLQNTHECFFFIADLHALTTHSEKTKNIDQNTLETVIDWLSVGINPNMSHLFVQSWIPEHSEFFTLLSMITPLSWLQRVPSYKDFSKKNTSVNYGFLGYPLLQAADILLYKANFVPIGSDQIPHIELSREIARRFNMLYGRDEGFEEQSLNALGNLTKKLTKVYISLRKKYLETGDQDALKTAQALLIDHPTLSLKDQQRLLAYLENTGKIILEEPEALLTENPKVPGTNGEKMSKSYGNTIPIRATNDEISTSIRNMVTDPNRVRRTDPGTPSKCPTFQLHKIYSSPESIQWVTTECTQATIGCIDCKNALISTIQEIHAPIKERAKHYENNIPEVTSILLEGSEKAREICKKNLAEIKSAMGLSTL